MEQSMSAIKINHKQEIIKTLGSFGYKYRLDDLFADWVEMMSIALSNSVDKAQFDKREARYMNIIKKYDKDELNKLVRLYSSLVLAMEDGLGDVLGEIYMGLDMGNDRTGQFFTPYSVSSIMARITVDKNEIQGFINDKGFMSVNEPTCGSGGMCIAMAQAVLDCKFNPQQVMHVTAQDIDRRCVHMTYVQLSLAGIPAVVIQGNTLALEQNETWYTPFHILHGWHYKLRARPKLREAEVTPPEPPPVAIQVIAPSEESVSQLALF